MPGSSNHRIDCGSLRSHNLSLFVRQPLPMMFAGDEELNKSVPIFPLKPGSFSVTAPSLGSIGASRNRMVRGEEARTCFYVIQVQV